MKHPLETLECGCRYQPAADSPPRLVELCAQHAIGRMLRITTHRRRKGL